MGLFVYTVNLVDSFSADLDEKVRYQCDFYNGIRYSSLVNADVYFIHTPLMFFAA